LYLQVSQKYERSRRARQMIIALSRPFDVDAGEKQKVPLPEGGAVTRK
jgi:hypothetical protein